MKITGIRVTRAADARERQSDLAAATAHDSIELLIDAEPVGVAIVPHAASTHAQRLVVDQLIDVDPRAVTGVWQKLAEAAGSRAAGADVHTAIAGIDIALWDLKAKLNSEPLWKALGGGRPRAKVHASPSRTTQPAEAALWAERIAREFGIAGAKLYLGPDQGSDVDQLVAIRSAFQRAATPATLVLDFDRRDSAKKCIRRIRAIEAEIDVAWVQGVAPDWDFLATRQVSEAIRAAVSVGRRLATRGGFLPHFHHRSANIIDIDIGLTGITGALLLADAAYGYELPVTLAATPGNVGAHLAGVMPYFMSLEIGDPASAVAPALTDVSIADGCAVAGDAPGHGLCVQRDASLAGERS